MNAAMGVGVLAAAAPVGTGETVVFWVLAPMMVLAALGLLFVRRAVHAALCMALVMVDLGVVYLVQEAPFLGAVQVFVYTGAVMMLFLFVVMLIGVSSADALVETIRGQRVAASLLGLGFIALLVGVIGNSAFDPPAGLAVNKDPGNVTALAYKIFGDYVWSFELTSALLITAALGAMVLTHRERLTERVTQRDLAARRVAEGTIKGPLPAPGVFARHNSADTPALLPDGAPSRLSTSRVLSVRGQIRPVEETADDVAQVRAEIENPWYRTDPDGGPSGPVRDPGPVRVAAGAEENGAGDPTAAGTEPGEGEQR